MKRALLCAPVFALFGLAAQAQDVPSQSSVPPASATPPASSSSPAETSTSSALKPGMTVKDSAGETIGTIEQVGQTATGTPAVVVNVDGKSVGLPSSILKPGGTATEAISSATKAQIKAASGANPPG